MRLGFAIVVAATLLFSSTKALAHVAITEGDVAIVAIYTGPGPAEISFHFVTLSDFRIGETVRFTDRGWRAASGFRIGPGEGDTRWDVTAPTRGGTVIFLPASGGIDLAVGGDQLFAFEGSIGADGSFSDLLVYGLNLGGPWATDATSDTTSALPPSLTTASVALGSFSNCSYAGATRGTKAELLTLIGDGTNWTCSNTLQPPPPSAFMVLAARGDSCAADADCAADLCAGGVCCDTACRRGEAGHCSTCDFGPADPRTVTCQAAPSTLSCRESRGACDSEERCDGESTECPADTLHAAAAICRASTGSCDPEERCTGTDPMCPEDALRDPSSCDDGDACTADTCTPDGGCDHTSIAGCCGSDDDCDDGDPCTVDICRIEARCVSVPAMTCAEDAGAADSGRSPIPPVGGVGGGGTDCTAAGEPPLGSGLCFILVALVALFWRRRD